MARLCCKSIAFGGPFFYFETERELNEGLERNQQYEEWEIEFISGTFLECEFANAYELELSNVLEWIDLNDDESEEDIKRFIAAVRIQGRHHVKTFREGEKVTLHQCTQEEFAENHLYEYHGNNTLVHLVDPMRYAIDRGLLLDVHEIVIDDVRYQAEIE
jgi:hypothetical protein